MRWGPAGGYRTALTCAALIGLAVSQGCNDTDTTVRGSSDGTAQANVGPTGPGGAANPGRSRPAPVEEAPPPKPSVADVRMSEAEKAKCNVFVGDLFPNFELPDLAGETVSTESLRGERLTVVLFWDSKGFQSPTALGDLSPDIAEPYADRGVAVYGIAVKEPLATAREQIEFAQAEFPNLLDADGEAFAQVGSVALPRLFLLDADGKILWFDIEYSRTTRRELARAIESVVGPPEGADDAAE